MAAATAPNPAEAATAPGDLPAAPAGQPLDQRAVVLQVDAEGLDYGEVARVLALEVRA